MSQETPFRPEIIDEQLEAPETDPSATPNRQFVAALQQHYAAEQQEYQASLQQVRRRLLSKHQPAAEAPLPRQEPVAAPARRLILWNRTRQWRGGLSARLGALTAALIILLVGGLVAGLVLVRAGGTRTGGTSPGGIEVRFRPSCAIPPQSCTTVQLDALPKDRAVLQQRLQDALGSAPWAIHQDGSDYVIDLPPLEQPQDTIKLLGQTGVIEILDTGEVPLLVSQPVPESTSYPVPFTGDDIDPASVQAIQDPVSSLPGILFEFKESARSAFADYTAAHIGDYLTIALDNVVIESAIIQSQITGQAFISGSFMTLDQAQRIAVLMRSGPLPLPLQVISEQQV